jgi:hypothetical protein
MKNRVRYSMASSQICAPPFLLVDLGKEHTDDTDTKCTPMYDINEFYISMTVNGELIYYRSVDYFLHYFLTL